MKTPIALLLASPLLLAPGTPADRVAFRPEERSSASKAFESRFELTLEDLSLSVMGQEVDSSMMGDPEVEIVFESSVEVTDDYVAIGDGRPKRLRRSFDNIEATQSFTATSAEDSGNESMELESELTGKKVVFRWNADASKYDIDFDEGVEGDRELLAGLVEDMDLRVFLPSDEVKEGDSWKIAAKELFPVVAPGGDLGFAQEDEDTDIPEELAEVIESLQERAGEMLEKSLHGDVVATYKGRRDVDGLSLGVIEIELDIDATIDFADMMLEVIERITESEGGSKIDLDISVAQLELELDGDAVLQWNLAAGHFRTFELTGTVSMSVALEMSGEIEGENGSMSLDVEFSGSVSSSAKLE